jgi:hypothetical protein
MGLSGMARSLGVGAMMIGGEFELVRERVNEYRGVRKDWG